MKNEAIKEWMGKKAPSFCLPNQKEEKICLKNLLKKNKKILLFFYPKDMTSGCTTEAVNFSEAKRKFSSRGIILLGISKSNPSSKRKFIEKNKLKVDLLSDEDLKISDKYGVWKEKNMYGKKVMGINRESFLIGEDGKIIKHWLKVKPSEHIDEIIKFLDELKSK